jgi:hypothetical protein
MKSSIRRITATLAALSTILICTNSAADTSLPGYSVDYDFVPSPDEHPERAWQGRAYVHPAAQSAKPLPVIVFMHGVNTDHVRYRFVGGGQELDVRQVVADLIDQKLIEPSILAAPSTVTSCEHPLIIWPQFDLGHFLSLTAAALGPQVELDMNRVVLLGHSGAGCNRRGGLVSAMRSFPAAQAILAIDTCMALEDVPFFARAPSDADLVISWQPRGWTRQFEMFEELFMRHADVQYARGLRKVEGMDISEPRPHTAIVSAAMRKWLPNWLPPHPVARRQDHPLPLRPSRPIGCL